MYAASDEPLSSKLDRYRSFLDSRLLPSLSQLIFRRDALLKEKAEWKELESALSLLRDESPSSSSCTTSSFSASASSFSSLCPFTARVSIGSDMFLEAQVADSRLIFVQIGLGFHCAFTVPEALSFISIKHGQLDRVIEERENKMSGVRAHVKLVHEAIASLVGLSEQSEREMQEEKKKKRSEFAG